MDISWLNNLFMAAAITAVLFGAWKWLGGGSPPVDQAALAQAISQGALLLDVRTPAEFAGGHVAGARNIPLHELPNKLRTLGSKKRPVLVYCRSGSRSGSAKRQLDRAGFHTVLDLGSKARAERAMQDGRANGLAAQAAR